MAIVVVLCETAAQLDNLLTAGDEGILVRFPLQWDAFHPRPTSTDHKMQEDRQQKLL